MIKYLLIVSISFFFWIQVQRMVQEAVSKAEKLEIKLPPEDYVEVLKEAMKKMVEERLAKDEDAPKYFNILLELKIYRLNFFLIPNTKTGSYILSIINFFDVQSEDLSPKFIILFIFSFSIYTAF